VLFLGPRYISMYGKCGYAKIKNGDKIGGCVASGSRVHYQIWKVWLCQK
jgi:hypothetical protein